MNVFMVYLYKGTLLINKKEQTIEHATTSQNIVLCKTQKHYVNCKMLLGEVIPGT